MSNSRKTVSIAIIAIGAIAGLMFLRSIACSRSSVPPLHEATGTEWKVKCRCAKCGHEFVGYIVGLEPGTKLRDGKRRYKKPTDTKWVSEADTAGVSAVKAVTCPKCGASDRDVVPYNTETPDGKEQIMY